MIKIKIKSVDPDPIPVYTYPFPQAVPIHILHLANEGMAHIEFYDEIFILKELELMNFDS
jgi:hypothetical protein